MTSVSEVPSVASSSFLNREMPVASSVLSAHVTRICVGDSGETSSTTGRGVGVGEGVGVAVGGGVGVAVGKGVRVGVGDGAGVAVGPGIGVGMRVAEGTGVLVGTGGTLGLGVGVSRGKVTVGCGLAAGSEVSSGAAVVGGAETQPKAAESAKTSETATQTNCHARANAGDGSPFRGWCLRSLRASIVKSPVTAIDLGARTVALVVLARQAHGEALQA